LSGVFLEVVAAALATAVFAALVVVVLATCGFAGIFSTCPALTVRLVKPFIFFKVAMLQSALSAMEASVSPLTTV